MFSLKSRFQVSSLPFVRALLDNFINENNVCFYIFLKYIFYNTLTYCGSTRDPGGWDGSKANLRPLNHENRGELAIFCQIGKM